MPVLLLARAYWLLLRARHTAATEPRRALTRAGTRQRHPRDGQTSGDEHRVVEAAQRAVRIAERAVPFRLTCLERSIALHRLCERFGVSTELRIGVRKQGDVLEAHAWVEHDSTIVGSAVEHCRGFKPLNDIGGHRRGDS
jgi:hypothetical protein